MARQGEMKGGLHEEEEGSWWALCLWLLGTISVCLALLLPLASGGSGGRLPLLLLDLDGLLHHLRL